MTWPFENDTSAIDVYKRQKINFLLLPLMTLLLFSNSANQAIWITNSLFNLTRSLL